MIRLALTVVLASAAVMAQTTPTENFAHTAVLDANSTLYWNYDANSITFETHFKARGYNGFGLSSNGSMFPGDCIIGWVNHNQVTFNDYHTTRHGPPTLDASQDWKLLYSKETADGTVLKFSRALDTGDTPDDLAIHPGNMNVMWAYNDVDPTSPTDLIYHHANRGVKAIRLIDSSVPVGK